MTAAPARSGARTLFASFGSVTVNYAVLAVLLGVFAVVTGRLLGPADRGVVVLFMTLGSILMVLGALGANTYARVALVRATDRLELSDYLGLVHLLALVQIVLAAVVGGTVLYFAHSLTGPLVLVLLAVYAPLNVLSYLLRDGLYAFGHNVLASRADPSAAAVQLLLVLLLWAAHACTLRNTLLAIALGQSAEVVYLALCYRRCGLRLTGRYRPAVMARQITAGVPALISNFGQTMLFRLDRILLGVFTTTAVVGIYSVAATSAEVLILVPTAISQVIFHRVATGRKRLADLGAIRITSIALACGMSVVVIVVCPFVVDLLFGHAYDAAVRPLRILAVAVLGMGSYLVDSACLNAAGRLRLAGLVTMIGALTVAVLDLAFIPAFAATGAAVASAVAYLATAVFAATRVRRVAHEVATVGPASLPVAEPARHAG